VIVLAYLILTQTNYSVVLFLLSAALLVGGVLQIKSGLLAWRAYFLRRSFESKIKKRVLANPMEPWVGGPICDEALPDDQAYSVELFNDNTTSADFVVSLLCSCFGLQVRAAVNTMIDIHKGQSQKLGRLSQASALDLVRHVRAQAAKYNFPFRCEMVRWSETLENSPVPRSSIVD